MRRVPDDSVVPNSFSRANLNAVIFLLTGTVRLLYCFEKLLNWHVFLICDIKGFHAEQQRFQLSWRHTALGPYFCSVHISALGPYFCSLSPRPPFLSFALEVLHYSQGWLSSGKHPRMCLIYTIFLAGRQWEYPEDLLNPTSRCAEPMRGRWRPQTREIFPNLGQWSVFFLFLIKSVCVSPMFISVNAGVCT